ncbi:putative dual-specificity RNA methyltransferase RlmN [Polystyrenella longa]|uniref:Probable dual-specificity RNA methyltransferase RlmN n=1 Tax=Polystyrenella longa TaxID=2528007 RepID=A0A518CQZ0_9PLAN|nr:23S rRNA (adenine(2503)-C(2))-methyltransferase RlmN [Polystyrenella longa]QDU81637.1 putative dual-specificity RNA methyltransferase RlmN [Polystyrenella longa]
MTSTAPSPIPFLSLSQDELQSWLQENGEPAYRTGQIWSWIHQQRAASFEAMSNLPQELRNKLQESFALFQTEQLRHQKARDNTEKLLLRLRDGEEIECVLMRETNRRTICISTQVGCAMGCTFCASGLLGLSRNLTKAEILEQIYLLDRLLKTDERLTNIVVMGIGEPLANLKELLPALATVHSEEGMGIGVRRVTISTVGLPGKIEELAETGLPYNLAISLHAPNDELRTEIVPVNKNVGIDKLLSAADAYFDQTGRRVSYEYILLGSINDRPVHAQQLADLMHGRNAHVNLIPMNDVEELPFHSPSAPRTQEFERLLRDSGVNVTVRKRKGADIDAACGQLRLNEQKQKSPDATIVSLKT